MSNSSKRWIGGIVVAVLIVWGMTESPLGDKFATAYDGSSLQQYWNEMEFEYPGIEWKEKQKVAPTDEQDSGEPSDVSDKAEVV